MLHGLIQYCIENSLEQSIIDASKVEPIIPCLPSPKLPLPRTLDDFLLTQSPRQIVSNGVESINDTDTIHNLGFMLQEKLPRVQCCYDLERGTFDVKWANQLIDCLHQFSPCMCASLLSGGLYQSIDWWSSTVPPVRSSGTGLTPFHFEAA
ncbi:hypothetical protein VFPPC_03471 [Pochonia chlamydosporia 170]|uniref:Uncharacterized protein n=1 Tax=Pochonia chlamydosporia 170 TaxID=1380566 RepID=A0A179FZP8_METCM|nr:hypothetical protein VFPPC_03471 [Pochonia chlamydosporia 170]OAQ71125.1 hypothetical protein VFPPC_03471 [Pochonia chlamydosporia 170]